MHGHIRGRRYRVSFENVAVSAVQDLFEIVGASGKLVAIVAFGVGVGSTTPTPTSQQLVLRARHMPANITSGSGGGAATISKSDPADATHSFTSEVNNTTKLTTDGTAMVLGSWSPHVSSGIDHMFIKPPLIAASQAFVLELLAAPTGTLRLSGYVEVEELGG